MSWQDDIRAQRMKREPLADYNGPVFVDNTERYYASPGEAIEALLDDGKDLSTVLAHPCTVGRADTPWLTEVVLEAWSDEQEEDYNELPQAVAEILDAARDAIKDLAPIVWSPRLNERVALTVAP